MSNKPASKLNPSDSKIQHQYSQLKLYAAEIKRELVKAQKKIAKLEVALEVANERVKIVERERFLLVRPRVLASATITPASA